MIGIVIVTHGQLAAGLLDAMGLIVGPQEGVVGVALNEGDDVDGLMDRVRQAAEEVEGGDGVLVLVDVLGASPFNASARVAMTRAKTEVLSGVSLPMLLELVTQREGVTLSEATAIAREAGLDGIRTLSETLANAS